MGLRFPVVLFDLGATLIYFDTEWEPVLQQGAQALTGALESRGYALGGETFTAAFRKIMRETFQQRNDDLREVPTYIILRDLLASSGYPQAPEEELRAALRAMYAVTQAHWKIERDALPMLEALKARGCRIGLISNASDDEDVQTLIDQAGLRPSLEFIISSAAAGVRKPHPDIFNLALNHFQVAPQQAVMVGDTLEFDVLGANALGLGSVWITRRADLQHARRHASRIFPDRTIVSLSELPGVLDTWQ